MSFHVRDRAGRTLLRGLVGLALVCVALGPAASQELRNQRLRNMRLEIARLRGELAGLVERERSLLGEVERLEVESRLRRAEFDEVSLRLSGIEEALTSGGQRLAELERAQAERRRYLAFRLREIYKEGPQQALRALFVGGDRAGPWPGLRYAAFLSERDGRMLSAFRSDAAALQEERRELQATRQTLDRTRDELAQTRSRLESSRRNRARLLEEIRSDQHKRESAIAELEQASSALGVLVRSLEPAAQPAATLDMRKFRGLLDWPAAGRVSAGFGTMIHPRFKTRVPHPGLDIDGEFGSPIHAIFDGQVVFAAWMRGYGLTAIVDHGNGLLSIYAHASVLLAEKGQSVLRAETLGYIGDTGSLRGPFLYFELRRDGRPLDPVTWLRPRP